jgi:hypothetical protein
MNNLMEKEELTVIHPMLDHPEIKFDGKGLGLMQMGKGAKLALMLLRAYLIAMTLLLGYHLLDLGGAFAHRNHVAGAVPHARRA